MRDAPWKDCTLEDLVDVNPEALSGSTPSNFRFRYIDINSVTPGRIEWQSVPECEFRSAPSRARRIVRPGDTLFCTVRPGLQAHAYADWSERDGFICSTGFAVLRPSRADKRFVFHTVFSDAVVAHVRRREVGSSYPAVNEGDLKQTQLRVPRLEVEQSQIAAILDALEAAIGETKAVVAKLRQVKAGLLHDLLTRGLDERGQLRDPALHPRQFQDSKLGWIPMAWKVRPIADLVSSSAFGPRFSGELYHENGNVATMRTTDMDDEGNLDLDAMPLARLSESEFADHLLMPNDVLVSRSGTCGITAVFHGFRKPVLPGAFLIRFRLTAGLLPEFLRVALNWAPNRQRLLVRAEGGVQKNLRTESITGLTLPFPETPEQRKILNALSLHEERLAVDNAKLSKLYSLKRGLAHDLLTGRVRVNLVDKS